jgi:nucleoredoxin
MEAISSAVTTPTSKGRRKKEEGEGSRGCARQDFGSGITNRGVKALSFIVRRISLRLLFVSCCALSPLRAQQTVTVDSLIISRHLWPREVAINVAHQVPLVMNGKLSGSVQVPAGRVYPVKSLGPGGVVVDALGSALTFSAADTDVLERAELTKSRLEALAASRASVAQAAKSSPAPTAPSATPAAVTNKIADGLDGKLVTFNGRSLERFEASSPKGKKFLAIYFSASWCGPCRKFTPQLVSWYKQQKPSLDKFDVIFVSRDRTKEDMLNYMKQDDMPWPALSFIKANQHNSPLEKYAGNAIPCLVLIDGEGKVISDSFKGEEYLGPFKVMQDLERLLASQ